MYNTHPGCHLNLAPASLGAMSKVTRLFDRNDTVAFCSLGPTCFRVNAATAWQASIAPGLFSQGTQPAEAGLRWHP